MANRFDIVNAPVSAVPEIKAMCCATAAAHRNYQPAYFSRNVYAASYDAWIDDAFQDESGKPRTHSPTIFAAFCGSDLAGYIRITLYSGQDRDKSAHVSITDIAVARKFQRQGVAKALIAHVKSVADAQDWLTLDACIWHGNAASLAAFQKQGFQPASQVLRYGPDRGRPDIAHPKPKKNATWLHHSHLAWALVLVLLIYILFAA